MDAAFYSTNTVRFSWTMKSYIPYENSLRTKHSHVLEYRSFKEDATVVTMVTAILRHHPPMTQQVKPLSLTISD